jgi:AcrR family transcriptional regulator
MDRRSHYLGIALEQFAAHGFHGVSMDQLVAAAGGSKATLYRYFASKEELFEAIIANLTESTVAEKTVDELAALPLEDGLRAIGDATARAALSQQATVLFRLAVGESVRFPALAHMMFERGPAVSYARMRDFIVARVAAGEIAVDDPQIAAEQFLGGIVGHLQLRQALGQPPVDAGQVTARIEAAITTFLAVHVRRGPT